MAKRLFVLLAAALVTSCSPPDIELVVENASGQLRVTLLQNWGIIFSRKRSPCVREAGLYPPETYGRKASVWMIEAEGNVQCLDLASFTIGVAPKGFKQTVPLKAARAQPYTLRVGGIGWGETEIAL